MCVHPNFFSKFLNSIRYSFTKKSVVHSKPSTKIIGILLLIVRFAKSQDQIITQIIKKKQINFYVFN